MKSASTDLITLLDSGKQFVMWDRYVFTLADGTQVILTSKDPDVVIVPAAPPPPPPGDEPFIDEFTGPSGTIVGHVPNSGGGSWAVGSGAPQLNGNGAVVFNDGDLAFCGTLDFNGPYTINLVGSIINSGFDTGVFFSAKTAPSGTVPNSDNYIAATDPSISISYAATEIAGVRRIAVGADDGGFTEVIEESGVTDFNISVLIQSGGNGAVYLNGDYVGSVTINPPTENSRLIFNVSGYDDGTLDSMRISTGATPP